MEEEAKPEAEDDTTERSKAWAKSKAREKVDIAMLADEARENTEFEARARNNANIVNRAEVESASKIRASDEIQGEKINRTQDKAIAKAESEIWENAEKTNNARESRENADAKTADRENAWDEAKEKEKTEITRVNAEVGERARAESKTKLSEKIMLFRGKRQRLPPISEPRRRKKEQRKIG